MPVPHPWLLWSHCVIPQGQHQCSPKRRVTDLSRLAQACLILKLKDLCPGPLGQLATPPAERPGA